MCSRKWWAAIFLELSKIGRALTCCVEFDELKLKTVNLYHMNFLYIFITKIFYSATGDILSVSDIWCITRIVTEAHTVEVIENNIFVWWSHWTFVSLRSIHFPLLVFTYMQYDITDVHNSVLAQRTSHQHTMPSIGHLMSVHTCICMYAWV